MPENRDLETMEDMTTGKARAKIKLISFGQFSTKYQNLTLNRQKSYHLTSQIDRDSQSIFNFFRWNIKTETQKVCLLCFWVRVVASFRILIGSLFSQVIGLMA